MPKKGTRKPKVMVGDPNDPEGLYVWTRRYLEWLRVHHYSERTVVNRDKSLGVFIEWCDARGVLRPMEVTKPIIERYQRHLYYVRKPDGKPLSVMGGNSGASCQCGPISSGWRNRTCCFGIRRPRL